MGRESDFEHYIKCGECGWEGWAAWMEHGYRAYKDDIELVDFCPICNTSEEFAEAFVTCYGDCTKCSKRFLCWTVFNKLPASVERKHPRAAKDKIIVCLE
mgnify:CR=1 FL=1